MSMTSFASQPPSFLLTSQPSLGPKRIITAPTECKAIPTLEYELVRGHPWTPVDTCGHPWTPVDTRGHLWTAGPPQVQFHIRTRPRQLLCVDPDRPTRTDPPGRVDPDRPEELKDLALGPDTVDVSMETLASVWAHDPCDLSEKWHEPTTQWGSALMWPGSPGSGLMWTQLSPHLQRNKQLQDTLLQKEEELAQLQEENNKLRQFLDSAYVRNLEEKTSKLSVEGKRKLKRNLMCVDDRPLYQLQTSQQISKRVCRNLTAEFCFESRTPEPNLDLWVLQTLGLKDRDTIDMSTDSGPSSQYNCEGLGSTVFCSLSSGYTSNSSLCPSVSASTPSSVQSHCQTSAHQTDNSYNSSESQGSNKNTCEPASSAQTCTGSPGLRSDFLAKGLYETPEASVRSYNTSSALQCPTLTEETYFSPSTDRGGVCPPPSLGQLLEEDPPGHSEFWSPRKHPGCRTPSKDTVQFSPSGRRPHLSPVSSSSPVSSQLQLPLGEDSLRSPSVGSQTPHTPRTPRCRMDLAFSMSLCPSSSVKTHSFPQGQAFVRKDTEGRWSFTWVPRQGP
ncbi:uncharacterized protein gmnc [Sphaeramia orbicularis]|uniref:uncharacterized protein gmnc n=1 Tax=Sphaeramia orbicularis TaxID=375764 RepID=UPI00117F36DE|nr:geminin coiled-coil domain-containing protein 1 [Sphaeramia orbicularis]